ncbi:MAG: hypothetical protein Q8P05_02985 [Candidatus Diapherotrites archaeon]|nr:hypothetical protein [Candidatus Diapherotrites archaeon]MDZ4256373.1 hypothetical protein [archaeon]
MTGRMTKPVPYRPMRGKTHMRPRRSLYPIKRGEVQTPFPAAKRSLTALDIIFLPDGKVKIPFYKEGKTPDELLRLRHVDLPNPYSAVRFSRHQMDSVALESKRLDDIYRLTAGTHFGIEQQWKSFNSEQKESARNLIMAMAGAIGNPNQLRSHHKKNIQKRLVRAAELLSMGNDGAALLTLSGAGNDILARRNQLVRQRIFLRRRHSLLKDRATIEQQRLEDYLTANFRRLDTLRSPRVVKSDLERLANELDRETRSMLKKREPELKQAGGILSKSREAIKENHLREAYGMIREANRLVIRALARQYLLTGTFIQVVVNSSQSELRKMVFQTQLAMLAENAIFWFDRTSHRDNMVYHLETFARASARDLGRETAQLVREAAAAAKNNMGTLMEEKLMLAAGIIRKTHKPMV